MCKDTTLSVRMWRKSVRLELSGIDWTSNKHDMNTIDSIEKCYDMMNGCFCHVWDVFVRTIFWWTFVESRGELWAQAGQVQGLGDVLEIEENLVPGDDGVKIQERKSQGKSSDEFRIQCFSYILYIHVSSTNRDFKHCWSLAIVPSLSTSWYHAR